MIKELFKTADNVPAQFEIYPQQRLEIAIRLYQNDEVTLMRAAEIAELDFISFQKVLNKRRIIIKIGEATREEIDMGLAILRGKL